MRDVAVQWWFYGAAVLIPTIPLLFARSRAQVAVSLAAIVAAVLWAAQIVRAAEDLSYSASGIAAVILFGYGGLLIGGTIAAAVWSAVRAARNRKRETLGKNDISPRSARLMTVSVVGVAAVVLAAITVPWWTSWRAGGMLADAPTEWSEEYEELIPAQTEFDTHGVDFEEDVLVSDPFEVSGTVLGWGVTRDGEDLVVLKVTGGGDSVISPGDRIGVGVMDPAAAGLAEARKGSAVNIRLVYWDRGPTTLRAVPLGGSKYDASTDMLAPLYRLYSNPEYAWDNRPARVVEGDPSWPVRQDLAGHDVITLIIRGTEEGATYVAIPMEEPRTIVRRGYVTESVATDGGLAILWNTATEYADADMRSEPRPSVTATLNAGGEVLEIDFH